MSFGQVGLRKKALMLVAANSEARGRGLVAGSAGRRGSRVFRNVALMQCRMHAGIATALPKAASPVWVVREHIAALRQAPGPAARGRRRPARGLPLIDSR